LLGQFQEINLSLNEVDELLMLDTCTFLLSFPTLQVMHIVIETFLRLAQDISLVLGAFNPHQSRYKANPQVCRHKSLSLMKSR
jgi:hypothetical protein